MQFTITYSFTNEQEAIEFLKRVGQEPTTVGRAPQMEIPTLGEPQASPAPTVKRGRSKKAKGEGASAPAETGGAPDVPEAPQASAATPQAAPSPEASNVTADQAAAALNAVYDKHGLELARDVLQRCGVKRFNELKPEQHGQFQATCYQALRDGKI